MGSELFVANVLTGISVLLIAGVAAILLKKINFPYTIGLVVIGIALGFLSTCCEPVKPLARLSLNHDVILYILLPTLIFEASVNIDSRLLVKNLGPTMILAAPGLILSTLIVGALVHLLTPLGWGTAILFGALISATDPVAVITLFKEIGAPKRLTMLVDGESLFNDATAIVMFTVVMGVAFSGVALTVGSLFSASWDFFFVFFGGVAVGAIISAIMARLLQWAMEDPLAQIAISTVTAYVAFLVADHYLGVSGVMSAMAAGIVLNWQGAVRLSERTRQYFRQFWEFAAFVANSFIFFLLGLHEAKLLLQIGHSERLVIYAFFTIVAVVAARAVVVYGMCPLMNLSPKAEKINLRYQTVIFWGGLRGAVPLALAFSLPSDFPGQKMIVELTLSVVLFTLLVQGTTIRRMISWLKLDLKSPFETALELQALARVKSGAIKRLELIQEENVFSQANLDQQLGGKRHELRDTLSAMATLRESPEFHAMGVHESLFWFQAISLERRIYSELVEKRFISESTARRFDVIAALELDGISRGFSLDKIFRTRIKVARRQEKADRFFRALKALSLPFMETPTRKLFQETYETNVGRFGASRRLMAKLNALPGIAQTPTEVVERCRTFYRDIHERAEKELVRLRDNDPERFAEQASITWRRIASDAELTALNELRDQSGLPEAIVMNLEEAIRKNL